jgi:gluconokinase
VKGKGHIIALDIGTTSTKGLLLSMDHGALFDCAREYRTYFTGPGMAEQDPEEVLLAVVEVIKELVQKCPDPTTVEALAFGGILHSVLPVDRSGNCISRAMIWSDMRALPQCSRLRQELDPEEVHRRTGCPIHPLYLAPRLLWYREEQPVVFDEAARFISIKEYVLHRLFGDYVVDRSIASGTGLMNNQSLNWDSDLLAQTDISPERLSTIVDTDHVLALKREFAEEVGLKTGTTGIIGGSDGPLAHLGSVGTDPAYMSLTVGTSAALRKAVQKPTSVPGSEAWCYYMTENTWVLGGVVHDAGNLFQWFSDQVLVQDSGSDVFDLLDRSYQNLKPGADGLYFLPFMSGERSPFYNPLASAAMVGMTFSHGREHIIRAMAEGISFRIQMVYDVLDPNHGTELVLSGGILRSPAWMRITADFLGKRLFRASHPSASAWGAALVAMRGLGIIDSMDTVNRMAKPATAVEFDAENHRDYARVLAGYEQYYEKLFSQQQ